MQRSVIITPGEDVRDRFDYSSERARHENFVGRTGLLARLDQILVEDAADRWVVITGGPGMGKSALLAAWLARRVAAGAVVPHHFIRRGLYDWDDPAKLVGSLVAQIEDGFPELREPEADERMHPAMRLSRALSRVSEQALVPRGARLVVLIDGLDEYDPPPERSAGDPLAAFLPDSLPAGVRLLCASRPRHPYVSSLDARDCELVQIDLDDPSHAADNEATVRAFWNGAAEPLHLDARFVDEAVARAGGNVQHAVQLRKRLAVLPPEQRRVEDIPRGLAALIERAWARVAEDPVVVAGLGILCAAREALTLDEIAAVADWRGDPQHRTWVRAAKELLVETQRSGGQLEYRLHHDAIRGFVAPTARADSGSGVSSISTGASSTNAGGALGGADVASGQVRTTATTRIACNATDIATLGAPSIRPDLRDRGCPRAKMHRIRSTPAQIRVTQWLALSRARCGHAAEPTISAGVLRMSQGTIKRLTDKGFGFIANGTGTDMFFHMSAVEGARFEDLREGQKVSYNEGRGPKGPRAENVRVI